MDEKEKKQEMGWKDVRDFEECLTKFNIPHNKTGGYKGVPVYSQERVNLLLHFYLRGQMFGLKRAKEIMTRDGPREFSKDWITDPSPLECSTCLGHGRISDADDGELRKCLDCNGTGIGSRPTSERAHT